MKINYWSHCNLASESIFLKRDIKRRKKKERKVEAVSRSHETRNVKRRGVDVLV